MAYYFGSRSVPFDPKRFANPPSTPWWRLLHPLIRCRRLCARMWKSLAMEWRNSSHRKVYNIGLWLVWRSLQIASYMCLQRIWTSLAVEWRNSSYRKVYNIGLWLVWRSLRIASYMCLQRISWAKISDTCSYKIWKPTLHSLMVAAPHQPIRPPHPAPEDLREDVDKLNGVKELFTEKFIGLWLVWRPTVTPLWRTWQIGGIPCTHLEIEA